MYILKILVIIDEGQWTGMVKGETGCYRRRNDYPESPTGDSQGLCAISRQEGFNGISALVVACIKHGDVLIELPVDGV